MRALGLFLPERGRAQVSTNVHDHRAAPLAEIVARVREQAEVAEAELVGLAPRAALEGFPDDVPLRGFSPGAPRDRGGAARRRVIAAAVL